MKRRIIPLSALLCAALLLNSCAKRENPTDEELHYQSFDAWMSLYAPQAEKQETGIYIEVIELSTRADAKTPKNDDLHWVKINYTSQTLKGDIFLSRDPEVAQREGTYESYIRYTPDYLWYIRSESNTASDYQPLMGIYDALALMKEGDKFKVYIPAPLAYGRDGYTSAAGAYEGMTSVGSGMPVIVDLELVKVIADPHEYEQALVDDYVDRELGLSPRDTVITGVYYKSFGFLPNAGDEPEKIETGLSFNCRYVGRFIKEDFEKMGSSLNVAPFVFDTYIKDTADLYNLSQYKDKNYYEAPFSVTIASNDDSEYITAWDSVFIKKMHYGEYGRIVTTSTSAYGYDGRFTAGATYVPSYTPLVFDVWISSRNGEGTYEFPYLIEKILTSEEDMDDVWIVGNVYGVITGDDMMTTAEMGAVPATDVRTNILISDIWTTDPGSCIPIELPAGEFRDSLNYPDNYIKFGSYKLKIRGDIRDYFGVKGMKNVREYKIY